MVDIPVNEPHKATHTVLRDVVPGLVKQLLTLRDVINIELEPVGGAQVQVTVHYAIMRLPVQFTEVAVAIERLVKEVSETPTSG